MSVQSLYTAATGMKALETKLNVIANNMANINTTGFKKDRANFEDLFYRQERLPGAEDSDGNRTSTGIGVGLGVRVSSMQADFDQGAFETTGNQYDLAIEGNGFFQVIDPNGDFFYSRAGNFGVNPNGQLVLGSAHTGWIEASGITIPEDAFNVTIAPDGIVSHNLPGQNGAVPAGQLQLATFQNPDGLLKLGDNLFQETDSSGPVTTGIAGQQGLGQLRQGFLESSNVEPVTELIDLITTQRSFELNSQVVQAGDQVMQLVANLRRN